VNNIKKLAGLDKKGIGLPGLQENVERVTEPSISNDINIEGKQTFFFVDGVDGIKAFKDEMSARDYASKNKLGEFYTLTFDPKYDDEHPLEVEALKEAGIISETHASDPLDMYDENQFDYGNSAQIYGIKKDIVTPQWNEGKVSKWYREGKLVLKGTERELIANLKDEKLDIYVIGDLDKPQLITARVYKNAIKQGFKKGRRTIK
jgi:hypothetical protein